MPIRVLFRWRTFWASVVNCDLINSKYSIFYYIWNVSCKSSMSTARKRLISLNATFQLNSKPLISGLRMFVRTSLLFSCEELVLEVCPNILDRVIKYEYRITQPLSIICSCIYYTTACFGQTVRPLSGILQSHINSDQGRSLSSYKQSICYKRTVLFRSGITMYNSSFK